MKPGVKEDLREAHELLDKLSAERLSVVKSLLEELAGSSQTLESAPEESEELTAEMSEALARARASLAQGKGIAHEEILREFGLQK